MHALEVGSAGQVAFATRAEPAWHMLGTVFQGKVTTAEMLRLAHLNAWNVRLVPAPTDFWVPGDDNNPGDRITLTDDREQFYVVRDNPFTEGQQDRLSTVGERYRVIQNEDLFAFGDGILDGGGIWETAGSIKGGRQVFGSLKLDREVTIDGQGANDKVNTYLLVHTSHDGTVGVQALVTPVRVVCQNTLNFALRGVKQSFKMRHTSDVKGRIAAAREALSLSFHYIDQAEREFNALHAVKVTKGEAFDLISTVFPEPTNESKAAMTRWESKVELVTDLFLGVKDAGGVVGAPITGANITGTAWGILNALTESHDWYRTARKGDVAGVAAAASGFSPVDNSIKNKMRSVVMEFAKDKGMATV